MSVDQLLKKFRDKTMEKKLPDLLKREFQTVKPCGNGPTVRIMQWNMLAQGEFLLIYQCIIIYIFWRGIL